MKVSQMNKALSLLVLLALLVGAVVPSASAQATAVAASSVRGTLIEAGSKHYLGLKVLDPTKSVKVVMDYRQDESRLDGGSGFYLFDEQTFQQFIGGNNQANLAAGALDNRSGLKQKIAIISNPVGTFSVVTYNDSGIELDYTLTAENALIVDDSGEQVKSAAAAASEVAVAETAAEEAAVVVTVAASTAVSETVAAAPIATPAPRKVATPVITRAESLQGDLEEQFAKHYFDLAVSDINNRVEIALTYDPQDQQELDNGFNVYAYSSDQFQELIRSGQTPSVAENTAAGTLTRVDGMKTLKATVNSPFKMYTLIVGNDSRVAVSYTLTIKNGLLVDASGQSNTAKALMAASGDVQEVVATISATTTTTTTTKADPIVAAGEIYVVKSGDTIATIARAAYGDLNLWDELCAFNSLENCDRIEVGQKITVPAKSELGTGSVTAPVAATTTATTTAPVAATTATTSTETTTAPVVDTTTVITTTTTAPVTATTTTTPTTIIDVAASARQFEILLLALSLANLTDSLKGAGPFTLFAPADAAFASLPEKTLDSLLADTAQLARVLQFHVVPQKLTTADITDGMTVSTLMGETLTFAVSGSAITVNGAAVNATELPASNGSVFIIDAVLLPAQ
ncbi:MAG: fasciclin domain-containing protein [Chloroflexi bacterium]|nr:fasciclin domain-containing protein [Chloroflexota bacterium]